MVKRILLATDGSEAAGSAETLAEWMAYQLGAVLEVLYVCDQRWVRFTELVDVGAFSVPLPRYRSEVQDALSAKGRAVLERLQTSATAASVVFEGRLESGIPAPVIVHESRKADLVVMGRHGEVHHGQTDGLGATAEKVVRSAVVPVIIAPLDYVKPDHLLVGYNGSEPSVRALHFAGPIAGALGLEVRVLACHENSTRAAELAAEGIEYFGAYGLEAQPLLLSGDPALQITQAQEPTYLVALGAFGGGPVRRLLLGSTTDYVLRFAVGPVLVVP